MATITTRTYHEIDDDPRLAPSSEGSQGQNQGKSQGRTRAQLATASVLLSSPSARSWAFWTGLSLGGLEFLSESETLFDVSCLLGSVA